MLKLAQPFREETCGYCNGKGTVPVPVTYNGHGNMIRGDSFPKPCPECLGKKVVVPGLKGAKITQTVL